jgi:hypothetical protein
MILSFLKTLNASDTRAYLDREDLQLGGEISGVVDSKSNRQEIAS